MAKAVFEIKMSLAWWWPLYVAGLYFAVVTTGAKPDVEKITAMASRAVRIRLVTKKADT